MRSQHTRGSTHHDVWIEHPRGRLFARVWNPTEVQGGPAGDSPIVLFHDSLGCVDLWRSFPAALCASTGRRVIAYDRLGFGRSDPRHDMPGMDFIADEARTYFPAIRRQVGFDRFIAFGHSVGGGMAVHCAAEFTDACEALITEAAQVFAEVRSRRSAVQAGGEPAAGRPRSGDGAERPPRRRLAIALPRGRARSESADRRRGRPYSAPWEFLR